MVGNERVGGQGVYARAGFLSCVDGHTTFLTNVISRDEKTHFLNKQG